MRFRSILMAGIAAAAVSCSSETTSPPAGADAIPTADESGPAPTTQAEVERLRAENALLRARLGGVTKENTAIKTKALVVEAKQKDIESGKLQVGMTIPEANRCITGSPNLYTDTCKLVRTTDTEWTYNIFSDAPGNSPGSGGVASAATNMRASRPIPVTAWTCVFSASDGKLIRFERLRYW